MVAVSPQDTWNQVAEVLRLIRTGQAQTRPELADATRLGRNVITLRIQAAHDLGLVEPSGDLRSRGGRAAEVWAFSGKAGRILIGINGATHVRVVLADLQLQVIAESQIPWPFPNRAEETCERVAQEMESLLQENPGPPVWGIGIGMLAPVDFTRGRSADPVTATAAANRWPRSFDVRGWFVDRMQVPVWIESVSNLMALGAASMSGAPADLVAVRMELGVGSAIVSDGSLHRGADWIAGETNHVVVTPDPERICLCGRVGCLDAFAGSWAVETDARKMLAQGRSTSLSTLPANEVTMDAIVAAAESGDMASAEIVLRAADAVGRVLATVVTWFNPRRVVIGGNSLAASQMFQGAMRRTLNASALAASLEHLEVRAGDPDRIEEVRGALVMVREALLSPDYLAAWGPAGSPVAAPSLLTKETQL